MAPSWNDLIFAANGRPTDEKAAARLAEALGTVLDAYVYADSVARLGPSEADSVAALARQGLQKRLVLVWPGGPGAAPETVGAFNGDRREATLPGQACGLLDGPRDMINAAALRDALPWTGPQRIGERPSIGLGDRLGLATPGHVRAVRGTGYVPMLAQQSIREMTRTDRSPQDVMDDATWGVFQTGFAEGFGADADHLKSPADIDRCSAVGFTFYTIDPGDHVDDEAENLGPEALATRFAELPWDALETKPVELTHRFVGQTFDLNDVTLAFDPVTLHRAAAKYGRAVAHTAALYRHLVEVRGEGDFELEVSVDETDSPTTPEEHLFVAVELQRLGVRWVSLAPRFVGRFEKGVDYLGSLEKLEKTFTQHLAIARRYGNYKISLHSGSDKFSVYEMAARHGGHRVHVKTAGTSYLEALRVLAEKEPTLFREILTFARSRYDQDRATYHVSAELAMVPDGSGLEDAALPGLLDEFHARQVLHVTFGSVLTADGGRTFRRRLLEALKRHEETYEEGLARHVGRHLAPFVDNT